MNQYSKALLADAKKEYTNQLVSILTDPIYEGIKSIYDGALEVSNSTSSGRTFQILLSQTPKWTQEKLGIEYTRIKDNTNCDYIEDLITAVFVAHTKILSSIKSRTDQKSIDLNIPTGSHFIHKVYIECARNFWKQPLLFSRKETPLNIQRNLNDAEKIIKDSILETIRKLLPVKDVLKEYLGSNFDEDNYSISHNDDVTSVVSENTKDNIRKLLKYEMNNTLLTNKDTQFSKISIHDGISIHTVDSSLLIDEKKLNNIEKPFNLNNSSKIENDIEKKISEMQKSLTSSIISDGNSANSIGLETKEEESKIEEPNIENISNVLKTSNKNADTPKSVENLSQSHQSITTQSILNNKETGEVSIKQTQNNIEVSLQLNKEVPDIEDNSNNIDIDALANTDENKSVPTSKVVVDNDNSPPKPVYHVNDTTTVFSQDDNSIYGNESISKLIDRYDNMTSSSENKILQDTRTAISKLNKDNIKKVSDVTSHQTHYSSLEDKLSPDKFDNRSSSEISNRTATEFDANSLKSNISRKSIIETVPENFSFFQDAAEF